MNLNRTDIIHMATHVPRRLNILCIMFKIIAFFIITRSARLYVNVGYIYIYEKHMDDRIISLRVELSAHKTSLTPPLFIVGVNTKYYMVNQTVYIVTLQHHSYIYI